MRAGWWVGAAALVVGVWRASTAEAPSEPSGWSNGLSVAAFEWVAVEETPMRERAKANFPADAWSQGDDFHASERGRALEFARRHGVHRQRVLDAFDRGLRAHWPVPDGGGPLAVSVAPCRPRPLE